MFLKKSLANKKTKPFFTPHPKTYLTQNGFKTVIREFSKKEIYIILVPKDIKVPYRKDEFLKYIHKRSVKGSISLIQRNDSKILETFSGNGIRCTFRKKGIGLYMYSRLIDYALRRGIRVGSSNSRNNNSNAIWKRLDNLYKLRYRYDTDRYYVQGKVAA